MRLKAFLLARMLVVAWLGFCPTLRAASKPILVHYMPWFVARPFSRSWGWHWTMNHFNPDTINPTNRQRQIASCYYPVIGPYDSADPAVLEYHVLLMKLAGIDGVVVDWYGMDDFNDYAANNIRTRAMFDFARKAGLKFALCYEDATLQQEVARSYIDTSNALAHAQQTMLYAESNFFRDPAYFRLGGAPVLLNFGPQYLKTGAAWSGSFSSLSSNNQPALFTEDNCVAPAASGAFDWPPMNLSAKTQSVLTSASLEEYLAGFGRKASAWPSFVSSAFPRFHDIYAQAGVQPSFGFLADRNGAVFRQTLSVAMTNTSTFVQVVTWNDFGEGTVVEPTTEFGCRDLAVIQDYRRQYLDRSFPYTTNALALPLRLYHLRKQFKTENPVASEEMDRIFTAIVSGNLVQAAAQLSSMESKFITLDNNLQWRDP